MSSMLFFVVNVHAAVMLCFPFRVDMNLIMCKLDGLFSVISESDDTCSVPIVINNITLSRYCKQCLQDFVRRVVHLKAGKCIVFTYFIHYINY